MSDEQVVGQKRRAAGSADAGEGQGSHEGSAEAEAEGYNVHGRKRRDHRCGSSSLGLGFILGNLTLGLVLKFLLIEVTLKPWVLLPDPEPFTLAYLSAWVSGVTYDHA